MIANLSACSYLVQNIINTDDIILGLRLWEAVTTLNLLFGEFEKSIAKEPRYYSRFDGIRWEYVDLNTEYEKLLDGYKDSENPYQLYTTLCEEIFGNYYQEFLNVNIDYAFLGRPNRNLAPFAKTLSFHCVKLRFSSFVLSDEYKGLAEILIICMGLDAVADSVDLKTVLLAKIKSSMASKINYQYL
jgi:hypothetical protein